ncbi:Zinc finger protein [Pseudolycoriella hygida]|uniref:Zinc finger protein n=1 Tax=Pseudolycoriella hygida TaxID=35572 RepID=A0A9Q0N2V5_9DIPT|nr:Zinc finger protein [Pseudolycoriella hygida]
MSFFCDLCGGEFNFKYELIVHLKYPNRCSKRKKTITKEKNTEYKCDICDKIFSRKESLINHAAMHTGRSPHKCFVCSKIFTRKIILQKHEQGHSVESSVPRIIKASFSCDFCDKLFTRKEYLKAHVSIHTGDDATLPMAIFNANIVENVSW